MKNRRSFVLFSIATLFACVFAILNVTLSATGVCACGTVDGLVIGRLNNIDAVIRQYRINHGGFNPTYSELEELVSVDSWPGTMLTPDVDFASRAFTFHLTDADAGKLGYAVSNDRWDYVLLGVGLQTRVISFFEWSIIPAGHRMPIWHPGDMIPSGGW
jgi:hypothetical protein